MKTTSKIEIEKAARLHQLILQRRAIEKEESELKEHFKDKAKDGVLEAGDIIILIECKVRTTLDRNAVAKVLGDQIKDFEKETRYNQITVKAKGECA